MYFYNQIIFGNILYFHDFQFNVYNNLNYAATFLKFHIHIIILDSPHRILFLVFLTFFLVKVKL